MTDAAGDETPAELRRRLAEAEETLRAIREGEIDALVVREGGEDEVFALGGGQDSYRAFMEAMDIGAAALDGERRLIYANSALCELLGADFKGLQQDGMATLLGPASAQVDRLIEGSAAGRKSGQVAIRCGSRELHVEVTVAPLPLDFGQGHAITFTDVTERIEAAAAAESERIGRAIMTSSNEAVMVCDRNGIVSHANLAVRQFREASPVGLPFAEAFPLELPLDSGLMHADDLIGVALSGNNVRGVDATCIGAAGKAYDLAVSAAPIRQAGDLIGGAVVTLIDMTERKAAEKRQHFLTAELAHRVKNTLTLVQSISNRTLATTNDLGEYRTAFGRRLEALAATHNLLSGESWAALTLEELVSAELAPYVAVNSERLTLDGLEVRISSGIAVALGLIFHELVTNAVKYGALSNDSGRIAIRARREASGALTIGWTEAGGPPVTPPTRSGFGQTVIARGLGAREGAGTEVEFRREGLACRIVVPASDLD